MGSIRLASKPGKHRNTKHIMNKFHLVRHLVEKKCLRTEHVGTEDQIADVMTKALGTVKFRRFRTALKVLQVIPGRDVTSVEGKRSFAAKEKELLAVRPFGVQPQARCRTQGRVTLDALAAPASSSRPSPSSCTTCPPTADGETAPLSPCYMWPMRNPIARSLIIAAARLGSGR
ncbi:hypothetical protein PR003_g11471 [Phytophthora rubi]|uniref:Uncharacterized protein n=1 Tax=Phytophthora rubi TaxID=129364 RepID=A0A6A4F2Y2_9STRA|nr:hypothetical protein PR003_g11471 [Phytophthora rubi]